MPDDDIIRLSLDGSHTVTSKIFNENYHSLNGAIQESNIVFIEAGLNYLLPSYKSINVFEMGFGTGLNALLAYIWGQKHKINTTYHTIEAYPLERKIYHKLNYPDILGHRDVFYQLHDHNWDSELMVSPTFKFKKIHAEIENFNTNHSYDVIFFDAFSPTIQPKLWDVPLLQKMFNLLSDGGILVSYCAQGAFKRHLKACGFSIEVLKGPPGKREMTRAVKNKY
ncbi:MAG: tRNA (5-methylaminomethyl-2-thiouridine)(34)-methyltransferase MnmD [Saprospiraceae bacterium]|nr:tRNA (5-methylaminomethyl-2-thiouridine)(34)-methyltransferase MnmD [Saprospiraceae bacterium]